MEDDEVFDAKKKVPVMIGLSCLLSIGVLIEILACVFWGGWWLLLVAIAYLFLPMPRFLCGQFGSNSKLQDWSNFLTGCIALSGFAVPVMLAHAHIIKPAGLIAGIVGGIVACASIGGYIAIFHKKGPYDDL